jgi:tetratricopeptide (TPR) repeat protein
MFKKLFGNTKAKKASQGMSNDTISYGEKWLYQGNELQKQGKLKESIEAHEKALTFYNDISPQRFIICYNLCTNNINAILPNPVKAIQYGEMATIAAQKLKETESEYEIFEANTFHNIAIALFQNNQVEKGKEIFNQSIELRKKTIKRSPQLKIYLVHTLTSFSESLIEIGDVTTGFKYLNDAISNFEVSLEYHETVNAPQFPHTLPHRIVVLLNKLIGRVTPEETYFKLVGKVQNIFNTYLKLISNKPAIFWNPLGFAQSLLADTLVFKDSASALKSKQSAITIFTYLNEYYKEECFDELANNYIIMGQMFMFQGEYARALEEVEKGLEYIQKSKDPNSPLMLLLKKLAVPLSNICNTSLNLNIKKKE